MIKKYKINNEVVITGAFFAIIFLTYFHFMKKIMVSDYIYVFNLGNNFAKIDWISLFAGGRFATIIIYLIYKFLDIAHVTHYQNTFVIELIGMLFFADGCRYLFKSFEKINKDYSLFQKLISILIISISVCNPLLIEAYMYGALDFGLGFWLSFLCVYELTCKKNIIVACLIGILSVGLYQTNVFYILIALYYLNYISLIKEEKTIKKTIISLFIDTLLCLFMVMFNFVIQYVGLALINNTSDNKVEEVKNVGFSLSKVIEIFDLAKRIIINMYGMMPKYFFVVVALIMVLGAIIGGIKNRFEISVLYAIITMISFASTFSFGLITSVYFPQRTMNDLFLIWSLMVLSVWVIVAKKRSMWLSRITAVAVVIIFAVTYVNTEICISDAYIAQAFDRNEAKIIGYRINAYENATGEKIETVASCGGTGYSIPLDVTYYCTELNKTYDYVSPYRRIMIDTWAQGEYINYINNTSYNTRLMSDEEVQLYFGSFINSGRFEPDKQLVFDGNTVYWRIY